MKNQLKNKKGNLVLNLLKKIIEKNKNFDKKQLIFRDIIKKKSFFI